jgi:two-component system chemotaxis response regulator CheY
LNKIKLLIVDDALFMRTILKTILNSNFKGNVEIDEAQDGEVALEKAKEKDYDLILMDTTMPKMDGITALEKIMKIKDYLTVVMMSSLTSQSTVIQAVRFGAKHFISKPFDESNVMHVVNEFIFNPELATIEKLKNRIKANDLIYLKKYIAHQFDLNELCDDGYLLEGIEYISKPIFDVLSENEHLLNEENIRKMKGFRMDHVFE